MKISVLIEPVAEQRFRVTTLSPLQVSAEGQTRDVALANLREVLKSRLATAEVVELEISETGPKNPWEDVVGVLANHPDFDQWVENIREYRRQIDADPSRL